MKYKKFELTHFAKECAKGANYMMLGVLMAGDIAKTDIGRTIESKADEELLLEVSKRFAKYAKDEDAFSVEGGEVQSFQEIIEEIVYCCIENDWFNN